MKLKLALMIFSLSGTLLAQTYDDNPERDKRIQDLINTNAVSKCADGGAKEYLDLGYLNMNIDRAYIGKSDHQLFVTIIPRPEGNRVGLYYCPVRNTVLQNGVQKKINVPLDFVSYQLGNLKKNDNCDFSDIQSGSVQLTFRGLQPVTVQLRPIMGNAKEQAEYKKLCSDKLKQSAKVQDVACLPEDKQSPAGELTEQVANTLKKKFSCDPRDIISGQMVVGAGMSVYVDEVNKKAEVAILGVYPGAKEQVDSVLKLEEGTARYELKDDKQKVSFELLSSDAGIYTRTYQNKTQAFSCRTGK